MDAASSSLFFDTLGKVIGAFGTKVDFFRIVGTVVIVFAPNEKASFTLLRYSYGNAYKAFGIVGYFFTTPVADNQGLLHSEGSLFGPTDGSRTRMDFPTDFKSVASAIPPPWEKG